MSSRLFNVSQPTPDWVYSYWEIKTMRLLLGPCGVNQHSSPWRGRAKEPCRQMDMWVQNAFHARPLSFSRLLFHWIEPCSVWRGVGHTEKKDQDGVAAPLQGGTTDLRRKPSRAKEDSKMRLPCVQHMSGCRTFGRYLRLMQTRAYIIIHTNTHTHTHMWEHTPPHTHTHTHT